jgi:hypothetical protein
MGGEIVCQQDLEQSLADLTQKRARIDVWWRLIDSIDREIGGFGFAEQDQNLVLCRIVSQGLDRLHGFGNRSTQLGIGRRDGEVVSQPRRSMKASERIGAAQGAAQRRQGVNHGARHLFECAGRGAHGLRINLAVIQIDGKMFVRIDDIDQQVSAHGTELLPVTVRVAHDAVARGVIDPAVVCFSAGKQADDPVLVFEAAWENRCRVSSAFECRSCPARRSRRCRGLG